MKAALERLKKEFDEAIDSLKSLSASDAVIRIKEFKIRFTGKKSEFTSILRQLGTLPQKERPIVGALANTVKNEIDTRLSELLNEYSKKMSFEELTSQILDVTLPGRPFNMGTLHPITRTEREIVEIFSSLGFEVADGPELEDDFHNFEALNMPKNHPARDMQDTLYIAEDLMLRSQTSNTQIREMEKRKPPIRIICPGRVYRSDYDQTHCPMFTQVEGLLVDEHVSFSDLKGTLSFFIHKMFSEKTGYRFRSSFFPFTEPSAEVDIECIFCKGKGCSICKRTGWLEILGCGMVNPKVLEAVHYDSNKLSGFAFGMGVERITMLKYRINDMRAFFENDSRFLKQF